MQLRGCILTFPTECVHVNAFVQQKLHHVDAHVPNRHIQGLARDAFLDVDVGAVLD